MTLLVALPPPLPWDREDMRAVHIQPFCESPRCPSEQAPGGSTQRLRLALEGGLPPTALKARMAQVSVGEAFRRGPLLCARHLLEKTPSAAARVAMLSTSVGLSGARASGAKAPGDSPDASSADDLVGTLWKGASGCVAVGQAADEADGRDGQSQPSAPKAARLPPAATIATLDLDATTARAQPTAAAFWTAPLAEASSGPGGIFGNLSPRCAKQGAGPPLPVLPECLVSRGGPDAAYLGSLATVPESLTNSASSRSGSGEGKATLVTVEEAEAERERFERARAAEVAATARNVRTLARADVAAAWDKLRQEFDVQVLVWESAAHMRAAIRPEAAMEPHPDEELRAAVEGAFRKAAGSSTARASRHLVALIQTYEGRLNSAMESCIHEVARAEGIAQVRRRLAQTLVAMPADPSGMDRAPLEALIEEAELDGRPLENDVLELAGLPLKNGKRRKAAKPTDAKGEATFKQISRSEVLVNADREYAHGNGSSSGSDRGILLTSHALFELRNHHRARSHRSRSSHSSRSRRSKSAKSSSMLSSSLSSTGGNNPLEVIDTTGRAPLEMTKTPSSNLHRGTPPSGMESGVIGPAGRPDIAPWIADGDTPGAAEAAAAVERIRMLVAESLEAAWENLKTEFQVQKLIWESVLQSQRSEHQHERRQEMAVAESLDACLARLKVDPVDAATMLEAALEEDAAAGNVLNKATHAAMQRVRGVERVAKLRRSLAARLEDVGRFGQDSPDSEWDPRKELGDKLIACDLSDLGLEYRVRRVLGLSLGDLRSRWKHYRHEAKAYTPSERRLTINHWAG